jgi:glycosyltransferase involved in cell wall biosynthesis
MKPFVYSVFPRPPHPSRDGLAIRNYHLVEALTEHFEVRAFSLLDPERAYGRGRLPPGVEVEWVPQRPRGARRLAAIAGSLASRSAYSELLYRSGALARRVAEACAARAPRWIVAHSYHVAPLVLGAGSPVWIDFHNLDSEIWERMGQRASSIPQRLFARAQAPRIRALESALVERAAGISCVSRRDAAALTALGAVAEPLVVSNGVDLSRYAFRAAPAADEMILFVGDLSWPPNAEGMRWFARRVWPLVHPRRPIAWVEALGRGAPPDLLRLGSANFVFTGEGDDTRPHWARAAVAIVPLLAGGGTRLKILEAAACGVPVVSTSVGAEGLALEAGTEIRLCDEPERFAEAMVSLLTDREAARRQAQAARARVEALYDWSRIGREFAAELARRPMERR